MVAYLPLDIRVPSFQPAVPVVGKSSGLMITVKRGKFQGLIINAIT
jgi:hypothetical protein